MKLNSIVIRLTAYLLMICFLVLSSHALAQEEETRTHVVVSLDNYYSLSLKYDISIEELKMANPGISSPKPGDILVIPVKGTIKSVNDDKDCAKTVENRQEVFKVALMIPLYLEQVADTFWVDNLDPARINEMQPFRFIQFYHGFMMAADSLRQKGLQVKIFVYDIDNQSLKVNSVLRKPEMQKMDLIVGPFFKNSFAAVADFARLNEIPIINPLSSRDDILEGNPYVYKLLPSVESQPAIVAELVRRDYYDHNVLLYVANQFQHAEMVGQFKEAIERNDPTGNQKVTIVDYAADSTLGFKRNASLIMPNLIIIYAENEVLPAVLLSKLAAQKDNYQITVIGLPEWEKFTNIESLYLIALNANIFMASYINTGAEEVKGFINAYRSKYFDEPQNYAFAGFDAGYFFLNALFNYGRNFERCLNENRIQLTQNQFHFEQKASGGYDNLNWNVLEYMDYFLLKKSFY